MTPIKDLINKIRVAIHDTDFINYDEREILNTINAGLRFMRRTIAEIQPEILTTTATGILSKGEDTINLYKPAMKIVKVTAGDKLTSKTTASSGNKIFGNFDKVYGGGLKIYSKYDLKTYREYKLEETNLQHIHDKKIGRPEKFYRIGLQTLKIYPVPRAETSYTVYKIDDLEELKFEDETPILNDFDDFLFEYAVTRLSLTEEYDMTQEAQIFANIHQQIAQLLAPPPAGTILRSYW